MGHNNFQAHCYGLIDPSSCNCLMYVTIKYEIIYLSYIVYE